MVTRKLNDPHELVIPDIRTNDLSGKHSSVTATMNRTRFNLHCPLNWALFLRPYLRQELFGISPKVETVGGQDGYVWCVWVAMEGVWMCQQLDLALHKRRGTPAFALFPPLYYFALISYKYAARSAQDRYRPMTSVGRCLPGRPQRLRSLPSPHQESNRT